MKTLCVTLALLLLTVCCIDALPAAVNFSAAPRSCCFKFNTKNLPRRVVSDVTETHSQCENKAFIVKTVRGKQLCYSHTSQWAQGLFNQFHSTEGSGLRA